MHAPVSLLLAAAAALAASPPGAANAALLQRAPPLRHDALRCSRFCVPFGRPGGSQLWTWSFPPRRCRAPGCWRWQARPCPMSDRTQPSSGASTRRLERHPAPLCGEASACAAQHLGWIAHGRCLWHRAGRSAVSERLARSHGAGLADPGKFLDHADIASFDAAVFFPEQPDKLTFWEQYEMACINSTSDWRYE